MLISGGEKKETVEFKHVPVHNVLGKNIVIFFFFFRKTNYSSFAVFARFSTLSFLYSRFGFELRISSVIKKKKKILRNFLFFRVITTI